MKGSKRQGRVMFSRLVVGVVLFVGLGLAGCAKPAASSANSCDAYYKRLCGKIEVESNECNALKTATSLMPSNACAAGLDDANDTVKKLTEAQTLRHDLAEKVCTAVGPASAGCKSVTESFKRLNAGQAKGISEHLPEVIANVKRRAGDEASAQRVSTSEPSNELGASSLEGTR